jgi:hypothetical protein
MPLLFAETKYIIFILANFSNIIFDYIVRNKLGGTNFTYHIIKQLPIIPLDKYSSEVTESLKKKLIELTYTSCDLKPFAKDIGYSGEPYAWDEDRRLTVSSEIDAIYAHLYEITNDDLDYILETFPIVKRKNIEQYNEYRTKRIIREKYEELKPMFQ